jgi:hypothetical protein
MLYRRKGSKTKSKRPEPKGNRYYETSRPSSSGLLSGCKKVAQYTEERAEVDGKKVVRRTCAACGKVTESPA